MRRQLVGKVVGVHGLRGELKVRGLVKSLDRFMELKEVGIADPDKPEQECLMRKVLGARIHKGHMLLLVEGVVDRDGADALRRFDVFIPYEQRRTLDDDEFFLDDIEGLEAYGPEGERLGTVRAFLEGSGGAGVIEVRGEGSAALDVPFCEDFVAGVDIAAGRLELTARYPELVVKTGGPKRGRMTRAR